MSLRRTLGVIFLALLALVGGTWMTMKLTTDRLLYEDATSSARDWARYLTENVKDLEQIAGGEEPSFASMSFFALAQRSGQVFRYVIFNRQGYSQLVSDRSRIALVNVSQFSAEAASSVAIGQPVVEAKSAESADMPAYFATAYVPVMMNQRLIAVVAAYVDQGEKQQRFYNAFLTAGAVLCLLTAVAFGVPASAWIQRTEQNRMADARIQYLASHDAMTRLANRNTFIERLRRSSNKLPKNGSPLAVHYINIDRLGAFNLAHGRSSGDQMLSTIADRLRELAGPGSFTARIGGGEFAVLQTKVAKLNDVQDFARAIVARLAESLSIEGHDRGVTASVGVAGGPNCGTDPEELMRRARIALNKSRSDGGNRFCLFTKEIDSENQQSLELEALIRDTTAQGKFELAYQAILSVDNKTLLGFEALLRLPGAAGQLVSPAVFVPIAEKLGLIDAIGTWVLDEACRFAATWPKSLSVSVNLSPAQFAGGNVCKIVAETLARYSLEPARLELEITESLLLNDTELVMLELRKLKELGVKIALDDFGTGYSSLAYLWRFPFDKLKIDRAFIWAYDGGDGEAGMIMRTIVTLARSLDMRVTVEGVENETQAAFVRELGCEEVQGFLYARPVPASALSAAILKKAKAGLSGPNSRTAVAAA